MCPAVKFPELEIEKLLTGLALEKLSCWTRAGALPTVTFPDVPVALPDVAVKVPVAEFPV